MNAVSSGPWEFVPWAPIGSRIATVYQPPSYLIFSYLIFSDHLMTQTCTHVASHIVRLTLPLGSTVMTPMETFTLSL